jgi:DNA-directed RNA polymerase specialized sigma24 family protein
MTFEEFFRERYGEVVRSMRLMTGDHARAEELTQEAFARACRHWRRVRTLDRPVAWVYVTATNEARREWRREQRAASTATSPPAVVLRYVADLPIAEIAEVMGCAPGTVKATLHQALAHMRVELEDDDED